MTEVDISGSASRWGHLKRINDSTFHSKGIWYTLEGPDEAFGNQVYIFVDMERYRPASNFKRILETLPSDSRLLTDAVYVSWWDLTQLNSAGDRTPVFLTTKEAVPKPRWKCDRECQDGFDLNEDGVIYAPGSAQKRTSTAFWLGDGILIGFVLIRRRLFFQRILPDSGISSGNYLNSRGVYKMNF